ncbi:hypothetical protein TSAR_013252 [Trichomalopsis sarcophagae]|uniref:Ionotropic glutamate receptor L-glutamate and glycine-binding domain-containing protein n=1 Tax=Trichomalopsis sarcophagae TaxID=543379 RepID=A0A232FLB1_9HYME|nr:hypothetical protein TSAR_013252 [Trichomalopsis sarcophagae]
MSTASLQIIQELTNRFPLTMMNIKELVDEDHEVVSYNIEGSVLLKPQLQILKIIIVDDGADEENVTSLLVDNLLFLNNHSYEISGRKCLVILVSKIGNREIFEFLKFGWRFKFLHLTVVEIVKQDSYENKGFAPLDVLSISVHYFNPFNSTYIIKKSSNLQIDLFPNKLRNLYGFPLYAVVQELAPYVVKIEDPVQDNVLNSLYGTDVTITQEFAKFLNYTPNVTFLDAKKQFDEYAFSINDYAVNLFCATASESLSSQSSFEVGNFLYPSDVRVVVKLYFFSVSRMSLDMLIAIIITIVFIRMASLLLRKKSDKNVWSTLKIIKVLIGQSYEIPLRNADRIFFSSLLFLNLTIMADFTKQLLNSCYNSKEVMDIRSLSDLDKSGLVYHISKGSMEANRKLRFKNAIQMDESGGYEKCLTHLIDERNDVQGCEITESLAFFMKRIYKNHPDWILEVVHQPISTGWVSMMFSKGTPYQRRFDRLLRRLFESGLINFWNDHSFLRYVLSHEEIFMVQVMRSEDTESVFSNVYQDPWQDQFFYNFAIAQCFSLLVFLAEVAWSMFTNYKNRRVVRLQ